LPDRYVPRDADAYGEAFARLFPQGIAWPRAEESIFQRVIRGLAAIFGDVDARAAVLLRVESDPRLTYEILPEWEAAFGLPDPCVPKALTLAERRVALVNKMTTIGGQSREFFIGVAATLGYAITITEFSPFQFGVSSFGGARGVLNIPGGRYVWRVTVPDPRTTRFRFGASSFGRNSFLEITRAEDLECVLSRWKPAHTILQFDYSGA